MELVRQLQSWEKGGWRVQLTTHLHLLSKSRMCGALPSLPNTDTYFSFLITKLPGPLISMFFPTALIPAPWATRTSGKVRGSMDGTSSSGIPANSARQPPSIGVPVKKLPVAQLSKNIRECYGIRRWLVWAEQSQSTISSPSSFKYILILSHASQLSFASDLPQNFIHIL